ncbi:hypothetical protein QN277_004354 [Acacia crassicarpa]|uniref:Retrovirus-related Pol polyprotein from transposon RE1 n=1 Tax=Acacia crassicarpa TaxID=499986 RepID=A0AAE1J066_9FABA|nr:hypothetical protein QN277_004354 [Acacia crassicarpa]
MSDKLKLTKDSGVPLADGSSYRTLVGRLLYLANTQPDISFSIQQLNQFVQHPTDVHLKAAHRVLRYLKAAPGRGLFFPVSSTMKLNVFSDFDWAGCIDTRRSITGFCGFLDQALITWRSKKQQTVSTSSSEAEYRALATTTCELQWLSYLLRDFGFPLTSPASLYCDSQSARHIAANPTFHERTKYLDIDCHVVREKLQNGLIHLLPIKSQDQLADIFTKPLAPLSFSTLLSQLRMIDIHSPA